MTQEQNGSGRPPEDTSDEVGTETAAPREETAEGDADDAGEEDGVDLSDLDGGMDSALDAIRSRGDDPSPEELESIRRTPPLRRNPWLAGVVLVLGALVMAWMWADFRYWTRRAPEDLGDAATLFEDGEFKANYDNRWVRLEGTPDVQHAARIETKQGSFGYVRLQEGRGSLYAMVPREDQRRDDRFEGVFEGRMRRLDRSRHFEEAQAFFDGERITTSLDLDRAALLDAVEDGGLTPGATVATEAGGTVRVDEDDLLSVVVKNEQVTELQLGIDTWATDEAADAAVDALGVAWTRIAGPGGGSGDEPRPGAKLKRTLVRTYVVAASPAEARKLAARLDAAAGVKSGGADPKVGSAALPQTHTYVMSPLDLRMVEGRLAFDYAGGTTEPPYEVEGDSVAPRPLLDGELRLDPDEISALRLEQQIRLDPQGYVVVVEETPDQHRKWAVLFLIVAIVMSINATALVLRLRRSTRS